MTSSILLMAWFNAFKPSCFSGVEVVITEKKNYSFLVSSAACFANTTYRRTECFLQLHDLTNHSNGFWKTPERKLCKNFYNLIYAN
jgi:hypothetical protein